MKIDEARSHNLAIVLIGFMTLISLVLHILIASGLFIPPVYISISFTAGMILAWFFSSKCLRILNDDLQISHPWKSVFEHAPVFLKYLTFFLIFYAIFNFALVLSFKPTDGYVTLHPSSEKIRGLSGFWIAVNSLAFMILITVEKLKRMNRDDTS